MRVAAGENTSFVVDPDGQLWAWGRGLTGAKEQILPARVMKGNNRLEDVVAVAAGVDHSLAVDGSGRLWAWGKNTEGKLGTGAGGPGWASAGAINALKGVSLVSTGEHHSLALDTQGRVWAWGYNRFGQLGTGDTERRLTPTVVSGVSDVVAISAGPHYSLAVDSKGQVWAWGDNEFGALGTGDTEFRILPTRVAGALDAVTIAAGVMHSLAVDRAGQVWAWGKNYHGHLGSEDEGVRQAPSARTISRLRGKPDKRWWPVIVLTPTLVPGATNIVAVAAGGEYMLIDIPGRQHSLAIDRDGLVWSWGSNDTGVLGTGDRKERRVPTRVDEVSGVTDIATSVQHSLARDSQGQAWAWGGDGGLTSGHLPAGHLVGLGEKKGRQVPTKVELPT